MTSAWANMQCAHGQADYRPCMRLVTAIWVRTGGEGQLFQLRCPDHAEQIVERDVFVCYTPDTIHEWYAARRVRRALRKTNGN